MVALEAKYRDSLVDDVEDRLWSLYGQVAHLILERANMQDLAEKRFKVTIETPYGPKTVSGQIDTLSIKDGLLTDWKFTTAYKFLKDKPCEPDWVSQLNMQRYILKHNPTEQHDVAKARIVGLLRDWSKLEARKNPDSYPQKAVMQFHVPIWEHALTEAFMRERITLIEKAKESLPECTVEERWAKKNIWAVMKGERAIRFGLCFDEKKAQELHAKSPGTRIEFRPGQSTRCEAYCSVSEFCEQFKALKGDKN